MIHTKLKHCPEIYQHMHLFLSSIPIPRPSSNSLIPVILVMWEKGVKIIRKKEETEPAGVKGGVLEGWCSTVVGVDAGEEYDLVLKCSSRLEEQTMVRCVEARRGDPFPAPSVFVFVHCVSPASSDPAAALSRLTLVLSDPETEASL